MKQHSSCCLDGGILSGSNNGDEKPPEKALSSGNHVDGCEEMSQRTGRPLSIPSTATAPTARSYYSLSCSHSIKGKSVEHLGCAGTGVSGLPARNHLGCRQPYLYRPPRAALPCTVTAEQTDPLGAAPLGASLATASSQPPRPPHVVAAVPVMAVPPPPLRRVVQPREDQGRAVVVVRSQPAEHWGEFVTSPFSVNGVCVGSLPHYPQVPVMRRQSTLSAATASAVEDEMDGGPQWTADAAVSVEKKREVTEEKDKDTTSAPWCPSSIDAEMLAFFCGSDGSAAGSLSVTDVGGVESLKEASFPTQEVMQSSVCGLSISGDIFSSASTSIGLSNCAASRGSIIDIAAALAFRRDGAKRQRGGHRDINRQVV